MQRLLTVFVEPEHAGTEAKRHARVDQLMEPWRPVRGPAVRGRLPGGRALRDVLKRHAHGLDSTHSPRSTPGTITPAGPARRLDRVLGPERERPGLTIGRHVPVRRGRLVRHLWAPRRRDRRVLGSRRPGGDVTTRRHVHVRRRWALARLWAEHRRHGTCWGSDNSGQATPPAGAFTALAAGTSHTCGIRGNRTLSCWGTIWRRPATPTGTFTAIASGADHLCAIQTGGTVVCWGEDTHGQVSSRTGTFAALSAGAYHTCGVRTDGAAACWGENLRRAGRAAVRRVHGRRRRAVPHLLAAHRRLRELLRQGLTAEDSSTVRQADARAPRCASSPRPRSSIFPRPRSRTATTTARSA